ncbi:hypothetical protein TNCV_4823501 [Trichonephila clavipes]|nr:hypothetical protein TNCV_4823501 [Trichonephila clavipes]
MFPTTPLLRKRREVRKALHDFCSRRQEETTRRRAKAIRQHNTPPAAVNEETLGDGDESSADESSSEANNTKSVPNCGGPHPANFSGCPSNPVNRKQQKKQPNKNIWTEGQGARSEVHTTRQQKPSYASVTAQNVSKTNTFDANSIMEQMGQMMQQWGTMIAFLQQNNKKLKFSAFNSNTLEFTVGMPMVLKKNLELKESIIFHNPDLIGIQETHLRPPDRISIPNYTCHRSDRLTHRGGALPFL